MFKHIRDVILLHSALFEHILKGQDSLEAETQYHFHTKIFNNNYLINYLVTTHLFLFPNPLFKIVLIRSKQGLYVSLVVVSQVFFQIQVSISVFILCAVYLLKKPFFRPTEWIVLIFLKFSFILWLLQMTAYFIIRVAHFESVCSNHTTCKSFCFRIFSRLPFFVNEVRI